MSDRQIMRSYLPSSLRKRVRVYAAKKGVSESSVTNAALLRYLEDANDVPLLLRKLERLERKLSGVRSDTDVLSEAFAVFVQVWFAHTPRLADSEKPAAEHSALQRFGEFAEHVADKIAVGASFTAGLRRADIVDEETGG
jgi:hypothetical protein